MLKILYWKFMKKRQKKSLVSFFVNLMERDINDVFKIRFDKKIIVDDNI